MKTKSTHQGHCQACNSVQKLPEGVIAKHGYRVAGYGFFNGICFGSGHKPLEQDKSIVVRSIAWANEMIDNKRAEIRRYSTWQGEHMAWFHDYVESKRHGIPSSYQWIYTPVGRQSVMYGTEIFTECFFINHKGAVANGRTYSMHADSTRKLVEEMNAKYIGFQEKRIKELRSYIRDQHERIRVWHEQPLIPIKDV